MGLSEFLESIKDITITEPICSAFVKAYSKIHGYTENDDPWTLYPTIMVSVSGGG